MNGYLINGVFVLDSEIAGVVFLRLSQNNTWVQTRSLAEFRGAGEGRQAIQVILKNGKEVLCERPQAVYQATLFMMLNPQPLPRQSAA